jgi:hypothetical protein
MWSCGDDDDSTGATGGKSAGGNAGKGGAAMTGGATSKGGTTNGSGGATNKGGGTSTTGGKTNGGSTGMAGGGAGGAGEGGGGAGPLAGAGTGGALGGAGAGAGAGGVVGEGGGGQMNGGVGGTEGGVGGGGAGNTEISKAALTNYCTTVCNVVAGLHCATEENNPPPCDERCSSYDATIAGGTDSDYVTRLDQEYRALMKCLATNATEQSSYVCRVPANVGPEGNWSPVEATPCESLMCTWILDDGFTGDADVYERCSQQ